MRASPLASARAPLGVALAFLVVACNPTTTADIAGGPTNGTTLNKSAVVSYAHVLMTSNAFSSALGWKAAGTLRTNGTTYLGRALNDTVRFASSAPLVTFEGNNNGGTTTFFSDGWTLTDGQKYSGFAIGVINATDPNITPRFVLAPLDTVTPAATKARVRFAHFMPNTGPVDVWYGVPGAETKVVTGLAFGNVSAYLDGAAVSGAIPSLNLIVTPTGVAPAAGTNLANVAGISNVTNPNAFTLALIFTQSNLSVATTRSVAIYQER